MLIMKAPVSMAVLDSTSIRLVELSLPRARIISNVPHRAVLLKIPR